MSLPCQACASIKANGGLTDQLCLAVRRLDDGQEVITILVPACAEHRTLPVIFQWLPAEAPLARELEGVVTELLNRHFPPRGD